MSLRDIQHLLRVPPGGKRDLQSLLRRLCESGDLVRTRGKRFGVSAEMNLAPGRLQMHPDGYGFVILDEAQTGDVFVKARELDGAMHGDRVLVRIEQELPGGRGPEAIARCWRGRAERPLSAPGLAYLDPRRPALTQDVFIPTAAPARPGLMVVAEIAWPAARRPEATVVEVLRTRAPRRRRRGHHPAVDLPHRFPRRAARCRDRPRARAPDRPGVPTCAAPTHHRRRNRLTSTTRSRLS
jgi:ribonuclease R